MDYHDIEGKDKDEDEENKTKFNKKASTYARTQASSLIGQREQQRSCPGSRPPEHFLLRDWEVGSGASEDNCDVWNDEIILHIIVYCIFSYLQSYLWWFFYQFY